jgi:hypothetical protein
MASDQLVVESASARADVEHASSIEGEPLCGSLKPLTKEVAVKRVSISVAIRIAT